MSGCCTRMVRDPVTCEQKRTKTPQEAEGAPAECQEHGIESKGRSPTAGHPIHSL